jgi:hypothetical protein
MNIGKVTGHDYQRVFMKPLSEIKTIGLDLDAYSKCYESTSNGKSKQILFKMESNTGRDLSLFPGLDKNFLKEISRNNKFNTGNKKSGMLFHD